MGTIEGDIFNESNRGTFLTSLDNPFMNCLVYYCSIGKPTKMLFDRQNIIAKYALLV